MCDMAKALQRVLVALALIAIVAVMQSATVLAYPNEGREIHIKGIFVLVDEVGLLNQIKKISRANADRQEFVDSVYQRLSAEPYIAVSSIRYSWPNEVEIEIREVDPIASVDGASLLLDDCRLVGMPDRQIGMSLLHVQTDDFGFDKNRCQQLVRIMPVLKMLSVSKVMMKSNNDLVLEIHNRKLYVDYDDLHIRIGRIRKVIDFVKSGKIDADYIDLRYASGIAIKKAAAL